MTQFQTQATYNITNLNPIPILSLINGISLLIIICFFFLLLLFSSFENCDFHSRASSSINKRKGNEITFVLQKDCGNDTGGRGRLTSEVKQYEDSGRKLGKLVELWKTSVEEHQRVRQLWRHKVARWTIVVRHNKGWAIIMV